MTVRTLRVVLDTNVLLSGISFPNSIPGHIVAAWRSGGIEVVLSRYILEELRRVLPRLSHRHHLTGGEINDLVDVLAFTAAIVEPAMTTNPDLRDANDQPVLGTFLTALEGSGAEYLITGDKDLLTLNSPTIITPASFWAAHGGYFGSV